MPLCAISSHHRHCGLSNHVMAKQVIPVHESRGDLITEIIKEDREPVRIRGVVPRGEMRCESQPRAARAGPPGESPLLF